MDEKKNSGDKPVDHVNEPIAGYGSMEKGRISFYRSLEEASEADYEFYRRLTAEQRMNIHYELSIQVFGRPRPSLNKRFSF